MIFTPAGMERFFERFAGVPAGADAQEAMVSVGREVDMAVLGPPLR